MKYYVSITGLRLKSALYLPKFGYYASGAMKQAQQAEGNIKAQGNYRNGVHHTLSVWKDKKSMRQFLISGAHAQAMKVNDEMSSPDATKVYGYETDKIPTWDEAIALWDENGTRHGKRVQPEITPPAPISTRKTSTFETTTTTTTTSLVRTTTIASALLFAWYLKTNMDTTLHLESIM